MGCQSITRLPPSRWQFTGTHLYSCVERGMVRVKCFSQKHNSVTQPGLEPRPLDPQTSAMIISPPCLPFMMKMNSMCFAVYHFHPEHRQLAAQLARCRFCFENPDIAKHLIIAIGLKVGWAVCYLGLSLYTLTSVSIFSLPFSIRFLYYYQGELA